MGLFSRKDWNIIAILFETKMRYSINANRGKGGAAVKLRDGVKMHDRTIFWAVFDQKRSFLEGAPGLGKNLVSAGTLQRLTRELQKLETVRSLLSELESGSTEKAAKILQWNGYPVAKPNA